MSYVCKHFSIMRFLIVLLYWILIPLFLFAQAGISDLINKSEHAVNDTEKIEAYVHLIKYYAVINPDSSEYYGQLGLIYAQKKNYKLGEARINVQLGRIDENQG